MNYADTFFKKIVFIIFCVFPVILCDGSVEIMCVYICSVFGMPAGHDIGAGQRSGPHTANGLVSMGEIPV